MGENQYEEIEQAKDYIEDELDTIRVLRKREENGGDTWGNPEFYNVLERAYEGALDELQELEEIGGLEGVSDGD